jgi:hypothetical protein
VNLIEVHYNNIWKYHNETHSYILYALIKNKAGHGWLMPVILATWKDEIRRITVVAQPEQNSL